MLSNTPVTNARQENTFTTSPSREFKLVRLATSKIVRNALITTSTAATVFRAMQSTKPQENAKNLPSMGVIIL